MLDDWGYTDTNGPSTWAEKYPLAAGTRQSPVDINTQLVSLDVTLIERPLRWKYGNNISKTILNTGYGWKVDVDGVDTELLGGPLSEKYKLEQFHCHWGKCSNEGSEHTVDGKAFAAELHLVHWNCEKYSSFMEAACHPDGLAVIGVFLQVDSKEHGELSKIVTLLPQISHKGQRANIDFNLDIRKFLPDTSKYWTYLGSLTTPPCNESVIWIVLKDPINVSEEQLNIFRSMKNIGENDIPHTDECMLRSNYRPPLPLGNRVLRECGSM
ncbi:carbonic anhydrase 13 isoform X2 [Halyomorpha halys]|uniref:carbonic anhydrase 13 isoform X2 n=1 Tax=Halyomorpha halys TaxID=286706 RepID=UPI0006D4E05C|nr:carbonic anhydrase 13 isoform X3 [Halyomorpha halys]